MLVPREDVMISYLKSQLKQNEVVKIHLSNGTIVFAVHVKRASTLGSILVIDRENVEHLISNTHIVQLES